MSELVNLIFCNQTILIFQFINNDFKFHNNNTKIKSCLIIFQCVLPTTAHLTAINNLQSSI